MSFDLPSPTHAVAGTSDADIAVVIPAYRQPGLLPEAVESVLVQRGDRRVVAVVVDDGCPMPETREAGLRLARQAPGRVFVLRRSNGGLSAARNTGVAFALAAWPGCRGVFFLDADNRLGPRLIERAADALGAAPPRTGWVVPDSDGFGDRANFSIAGDHSVFLHLLENGHDAGALVSRAVFEAGLRFDETLRDGFEDWDFWLRCAAAGFRGRHVPDAGFLYRRRAGGMRRAAESRRAGLLDGLRRRHAALLRPRGLLALEAAEVPRFLLFRVGADEVGLVVDPLRPRHPPEGREQVRRRIVEAARRPAAVHVSPVAVFASDAALGALFRARALHTAFHAASRALRRADTVTVHLLGSADDGLALRRGEGIGPPALVFDRTDRLGATSGAREALTLALPASAAPPPLPDILADRAAEAAALAEAAATRRPDAGPWRDDWRRPRSRAADGYGELLGTGAPFPWLGDAAGRDIALVAPIFAMGGVERVLLRYAEGLRARGWRPHLVLTGADAAALPPAALAAFETVSFPPAPGLEGPDPETDYLGAAWPAAIPANGPPGAEARDLLGVLAPMHAVLVTHSLAGHAVAGALRDLGVATWAGLHVAERTVDGLPNGNPHALLAHEGSYDGIVAVSGAMRDALVGAGVPTSKVVVVPNGPGYPAGAGAADRALGDRRARGGTGPLRALFLGRLDAQKGLDRLRDAIALTAGPVTWRVVGRAVLGAPPDDLGPTAEPPPADEAGLDSLYAWADLLVLPSRYEGSPLTVFEAARMGVPAVATRTGAMEEVVEDGVDGILIPDGPDAAVASATADAVLALAGDRARLVTMGEAAFARAAARPGWEARMATWLDALDGARGGRATT